MMDGHSENQKNTFSMISHVLLAYRDLRRVSCLASDLFGGIFCLMYILDIMIAISYIAAILTTDLKDYYLLSESIFVIPYIFSCSILQALVCVAAWWARFRRACSSSTTPSRSIINHLFICLIVIVISIDRILCPNLSLNLSTSFIIPAASVSTVLRRPPTCCMTWAGLMFKFLHCSRKILRFLKLASLVLILAHFLSTVTASVP